MQDVPILKGITNNFIEGFKITIAGARTLQKFTLRFLYFVKNLVLVR